MTTGWIKAGVEFPDRLISFVIPRRTWLWDAIGQQDMDKPDELEAVIRKHLLHAKPELQGCVIHAIHFSLNYQAWEILVSHESLPNVEPGQMAPREFFDPREKP